MTIVKAKMSTFERDARINAIRRKMDVLQREIQERQEEQQRLSEQLHFLRENLPLPKPELSYHEAVAAWGDAE